MSNKSTHPFPAPVAVEVLNRATIGGSIEISRLPGTVRVTLLCPLPILDRLGIGHLVRQKYVL
jgi:hypothetical protein